MEETEVKPAVKAHVGTITIELQYTVPADSTPQDTLADFASFLEGFLDNHANVESAHAWADCGLHDD